MTFIQVLRKLGFSNTKLLEWFPPFKFMGFKIRSVSADYRRFEATLPLRWYGLNLHGTMFGGFMASATDPLPAILCGRIFPDHECWTRKHCIDFLKPGVTRLTIKIEITDEDLAEIRKQLKDRGRATHAFEFDLTDPSGTAIAHVTNTVHLRPRSSPAPSDRSPHTESPPR